MRNAQRTVNPTAFLLNGAKVVVTAILLVVCLTTMLNAQTSRGAVTGTVTDSSNAVVPKAKVTLIQDDTNATRETVTNDAGIYRFDAVALGTHTVKVEATGFVPFEFKGVSVRAAQTASVDAVLRPGGGEQVLNVEATAVAVLQTEEQLRGRNIEPTSLANLPIVGQNSLNLMTMIPGIVPTNLSGGGSLDSGIGSVNGARPRSNTFLLDGVENNDISVAGPAITVTNNDAIQEVAIQTTNFSAEFGRSGGAIVNQITKSGTNNLHGTVAWVYRSEVLNASSFDERMSYYDGGGQEAGDPLKPAFLEHLPAFTVGGPVYIPKVYNGKNKTFFFVAGQWDRYNSGSTQRIVTVPTAAGIATLQSLAATCPNAKTYLDAIGSMVGTGTKTTSLAIPQSVYDVTGSCTNSLRTGMMLEYGQATRSAPQLWYGNTIQAKVDQIISPKQQLSFRFLQSPGSYAGIYSIGMSPTFDTGYAGQSYSAGITHTYVLSNTMTNELRLSYHRQAVNWTPFAEPGSLGATLPLIGITGFTTVGLSSSYPQGRTFNNYELQDTVSLVKGRHTLRAGLSINKQIARQIAPMPVRGSLGYQAASGISAFANFLDDFSGTGSNVVYKQFGTALYHPGVTRQSYFVQDAWKATSELTLNLGLRYDYFGQPANNSFAYPAVSLDPKVFPNPTKIESDKNNFGPSVGFAYNPRSGWFSDGLTVFRGGFQIGYDGEFNNLLSNMATGSPNNPTNVAYNATINSTTPRGVVKPFTQIFNTLTPAAITNPLVGTASQFTGNFPNPYVMRYSLGVQRELASGFVLDTSYVGSASRKLYINRELNPRIPLANGLAGGRLDPTMGSRTVRQPAATANYNALQVELRHKQTNTMLGALSFDASYTWSKNLDETSEVFVTSSQNSSYASSQWMGLKNLAIDYGTSDLDRRHRFVASFVWDVVGPKSGILGQAFGGWTLTGVVPIMSGTPFTVSNGLDRDGDGASGGDRPDIGNVNAPITTRAIISSTCSSGLYNPDADACTTADAVHWVQSATIPGAKTAARNAAWTDGFWSTDMNVMKKFTLTERTKLEFRAEFFNIFNHMNFNYAPTGNSSYGLRLDQPAGSFLPWRTESDYYTGPGNRTTRLGLKVIF